MNAETPAPATSAGTVPARAAHLPAERSRVRAVAPVDNTPGDMLAALVARGAPMEQLEKFMALKERHEANEARKAYVAAMASAKAETPTIRKDHTVSYQPQGKARVEYDHATIGNVVDKVVPWLARFGFSHRWEIKQEQGRISVTCEITHDLGHRESVTLTAGADDSGGKNAIQQIASTTTYLERYTLLAACGLATRDQEDEDGRLGGAAEEPQRDRVAEKAAYPDEQFQKNLPAWSSLVADGKKAAAGIVAMLETKAVLSDEQRRTILALKPKSAEAAAAADGKPISPAILKTIRSHLDRLKIEDAEFCQAFGVTAVEALPAAKAGAATTWLMEYKA